QTMRGALGAIRIDDRKRDAAAHHHQIAFRVPGRRANELILALQLDRAFEVRLDEGLLVDLRRAADVERAHGELRTRLTDRLRRDDADRFAHVDGRAAGKIATIAGAADAVLGLAGEHRTDAHFLHARLADRIDDLLLEQGAVLGDDLAGIRILDVFGRG